jgi:peptidoglycan hydrolase-like protein with peptidoglycan-binding domain
MSFASPFEKIIKLAGLFAVCALLFAAPALATKRAVLNRQQIKEAERRLAELGYWTGKVDGLPDTATRAALIAFQKWEGRAITGELTSEECEAIRNGSAPQARDGAYAHVEVDLHRQVLLIVDDEGAVRVLPVSTGSGREFLYEGQTSIAYTPRGRFVIYEKGVGWEDNVPGSMYYANYISGGIAIHGYLSVPTQPASHGCIRIPMFAARELSRLTPRGTIVLIYDKVSFVSGRSWAKDPKLKQAALDMGPLQ